MKKYVFKPYEDIFPILFEKEKQRLSTYLAGDYQVEHIGSTAVPGLGGKGTIDVYIAVSKERLSEVSKKLLTAGYQYGRTTSKTPPYIFHKALLADPLEGKRFYHVHLAYPEYEDWINTITFRDYLRTHLEDMKLYSEIKKRAANEANEDGKIYMQVKSPFIQEILVKAHAKKWPF